MRKEHLLRRFFKEENRDNRNRSNRVRTPCLRVPHLCQYRREQSRRDPGSKRWGKGQQRVGTAIHHIRERLPFPLLGLDSDNGSEFINLEIVRWCQREGITFTRSRPYKKNDNCFVEQKNGSIVRRIIGRDRYTSKQAYEILNRIYYLLRLYVNFFQPVMKLVSKTRHGARVRRVYDSAQTPYQRALKSGAVNETNRSQLRVTYSPLNPVSLLKQINANVEHLWKLRERQLGEKVTR